MTSAVASLGVEAASAACLACCLTVRRTTRIHPATTQPEKNTHWPAYERWGPSSSSGAGIRTGCGPATAGVVVRQLDVVADQRVRRLLRDAGHVDPVELAQRAVGRVTRAEEGAPLLRLPGPAGHDDRAARRRGWRRRGAVLRQRDPAPVDEEGPAVGQLQRGHDVEARLPLVAAVADQHLLRHVVGAARREGPPLPDRSRAPSRRSGPRASRRRPPRSWPAARAGAAAATARG